MTFPCFSLGIFGYIIGKSNQNQIYISASSWNHCCSAGAATKMKINRINLHKCTYAKKKENIPPPPPINM